jgi:hypothetical protein
MRSILAHLAGRMTFMRAEIITDVFAIEIARRLEDVASLHRYQRFTRKLPLAAVLHTYQRTAHLPNAQARAERLKAICDAWLRGEEADA